jgi:EmrB/QacA subfamily drug resistance transporter
VPTTDATHTPHSETTRPSSERRWAALVLLCASQLMMVLDGSIVAVALPVIGADLHIGASGLTWVVNAYLVPFAGLLLLAGRLGDLFGPRRVLLAGLGLFTTASLACGLAPRFDVLVVARFLQGVGGALASAVVLGMIVTLFPEPADRGRALGVFSFVGAAGSSIGLLAGGLLTQALSWPWIFLVNAPLGLAAVIGVRHLVPAPAGTGGRADVPSAVLVTAGLMLSVYTLLSPGTGSATVALLTVASLALLLAFGARQARTRHPLLPLRLLAARTTGLGNAVQALVVAGLFGFQFLGVLYLQQLLGFDPLRAGLAFLPVPVVIAAVSLGLTARLIAALGQRPVLVGGLAFITAGLALLTQLPAADGYLPAVFPAGLLIAVGFGLAFPVLAVIAVASAPAHDAGIASGLFNATQQVGGALGLAAMTRLATSAAHGRTGHATAALAGYHLAFAAAAALAATALLLALVATATSERRS